MYAAALLFSLFGWGHRRPYAFVGFVISIVAYACLAIAEASGFSLASYLVLIFVARIGYAMFDSTLDGFSTVGGDCEARIFIPHYVRFWLSAALRE